MKITVRTVADGRVGVDMTPAEGEERIDGTMASRMLGAAMAELSLLAAEQQPEMFSQPEAALTSVLGQALRSARHGITDWQSEEAPSLEVVDAD